MKYYKFTTAWVAAAMAIVAAALAIVAAIMAWVGVVTTDEAMVVTMAMAGVGVMAATMVEAVWAVENKKINFKEIIKKVKLIK